MDEFKPVAFDPKAHAARKREGNPAFRDAHDALDDEFAALAVLLKARKDAGLTQAEVATKMDVPNTRVACRAALRPARQRPPEPRRQRGESGGRGLPAEAGDGNGRL